jgi:hypothetical protein
MGTESLGREEFLGLAKEFVDLFFAIDMRRLTPVTMWEKVRGGNFRTRLGSTQPDGEAPDHAQTLGPPRRLSLGGLGSPAKREFCSDVRHTLDLQKRHKMS